ncbi:MAG: putative adhesin [Planctomycetota bacterium]
MTTVKTKNHFRLSHHEGATKVVLLCHGAWSHGQGYALTPPGMVVQFYSVHGQFGTNSANIARALFGVEEEVALSSDVIAQIMRGDLTQDEAILAAKARANATGTGGAMIVDSVGGRLRAQLHNYTLGYHGPGGDESSTEGIWDAHVAEEYPSTDVDLICLKKNTRKFKDLRQAIEFALEKGGNYQEFHFLPCRHVDSKDATSMLSVGDLGGFADGTFKTVDL